MEEGNETEKNVFMYLDGTSLPEILIGEKVPDELLYFLVKLYNYREKHGIGKVDKENKKSLKKN